MVMKNRTVRFVIPAAIALMALLSTGCENPTNSSSDSVGGDSAPADPHTLVLPAGTIEDWGSTGSGEWFIGYRGVGMNDDPPTFGEIRLTDANYPGQTISRSDFDEKLMSSESRGTAAIFRNVGGTTITFAPIVQMMRIASLYGDDGAIYRRNFDYDREVEWWYVSADTTVDGDFSYFSSTSADATVTDLKLQAGWNTVIFTDGGGGNFTVTTGAEPAGIGWYLE